MIRAFLFAAALALGLPMGTSAQDLTALARVDLDKSGIKDGWFGRATLNLQLTQGVPFRVFTLPNPPRLVVDFREVDWAGVTPTEILVAPGRFTAVRFGAFQPGWSRLVADMAEPMLPREVAMPVDPQTGQAHLSIELEVVENDDFIAGSGAYADPEWSVGLRVDPAPVTPSDPDRFVVVIDPGHGGIDPGAVREGINEKDLMLSMARSLAEALRRAGVDAVLTRDDDHFVALETRVALAHQNRGDLFISLHADILTQGRAKGAAVYTLSKEASDAATQHLAARHNRADIIAGADLTGADDQVAGVLLDLARQETEPRSVALADMLAENMGLAGGPMNRKPRREAGFSVLKSADIPSVLIEVGFLSSKRDLDNLRDPIWRAVMVEAIATAVLKWRDTDAARKPLVRQ